MAAAQASVESLSKEVKQLLMDCDDVVEPVPSQSAKSIKESVDLTPQPIVPKQAPSTTNKRIVFMKTKDGKVVKTTAPTKVSNPVLAPPPLTQEERSHLTSKTVHNFYRKKRFNRLSRAACVGFGQAFAAFSQEGVPPTPTRGKKRKGPQPQVQC